jgi:hypothetical protein
MSPFMPRIGLSQSTNKKKNRVTFGLDDHPALTHHVSIIAEKNMIVNSDFSLIFIISSNFFT